jgi:hypothetical protein
MVVLGSETSRAPRTQVDAARCNAPRNIQKRELVMETQGGGGGGDGVEACDASKETPGSQHLKAVLRDDCERKHALLFLSPFSKSQSLSACVWVYIPLLSPAFLLFRFIWR